jgi:hypothetical protein
MEKAPANFINVAVVGNTAAENITAAGFTII